VAKKIQAIQRYGPRLKLGKAVTEDEYLNLVTFNSGVNRGTVQHVENANLEALIFLLKQGRPVHTGSAIYTPFIKLDGHIVVHMDIVRRVEDAINVYDEFKGEMINAENVGKSSSELYDMWDAEFPDDLIER
jgi:hypothetical protein